jgi:uncharacterized integral membrane protein
VHKTVYLTLAVLLVGFLGYLAFANQAPVAVSLAGTSMSAPEAAVVILSAVLGLLVGVCIWQSRGGQVITEQKALQWKTEDAKLATEIQQDKVHQLELQVKTLESALDKALKRGKGE